MYYFFTGKTQAVLVIGEPGNLSESKSGTPKDWYSGPPIFLVLISDINEEIASTIPSILLMTLWG